MPPAARGSLQDTSVPDLLRALAREESTGILSFTGTVDKVVCLAGGDVYLAMSASSPPLPRLLEELAVADEARWKEAVDAAQTEGVPIADALVQAGAPAARLEAALRELTVGTLLELLVPGSDDFTFGEGETHQIGSRFRFRVDDLLDEAASRLGRWGEIADRLPAMSTLLQRSHSLPAEVDAVHVDQVQWRILDRLDHPVPTSDLLASMGLSAFAVFEELHRLIEAGLVQTMSADEADGPVAPS